MFSQTERERMKHFLIVGLLVVGISGVSYGQGAYPDRLMIAKIENLLQGIHCPEVDTECGDHFSSLDRLLQIMKIAEFQQRHWHPLAMDLIYFGSHTDKQLGRIPELESHGVMTTGVDRACFEDCTHRHTCQNLKRNIREQCVSNLRACILNCRR